MRPPECIPSDLRDRLDAAREELDVDVEWVERGDPRCMGRDFGYWRVRAGRYGWREMDARRQAWRDGNYGVTMDPSIPPDAPSACTAEGTGLAECIVAALDLAEKQAERFRAAGGMLPACE